MNDIKQAWDSVSPDAQTQTRILGRVLSEAGTQVKPRATLPWLSWKVLVPVGAVLALIAAVVIPAMTNRDFPLIDSHGVSVVYVGTVPSIGASFDLVPMTEAELVTGVDIFFGKIIRIDSIKVEFSDWLEFSDWDDYMSVLTIEVGEVVRGNPGSTTSVLVHPAVGVVCSVCEVTQSLTVGTEAVFLARPSTPEAFAASVDMSEVFYYSDAAPYYLSDPARPIFTQKGALVQYDEWAWPSMDGVTSLAEVIQVLRTMIE